VLVSADAFSIVSDAVRRGPIPAAAAAVGDVGGYRSGFFGRLLPFDDWPAVGPETLFDLASLTKVLCAVPLLLRVVTSGRIDPAAPLAEALPDLGGFPLGERSLLEVVSHTAGLNAYSDLRWWDLPREEALRKALEEPTPREVGLIHYSDQGFIALTYLIEHCYGRRLDEVARTELYEPLGVGIRYNPAEVHLCAPTEIYWGNRDPVQGTVHDENAAALEGVSAHAGLFGTANDVARFLQALLDGNVVPEAGLALMRGELARASDDRRAFGWVMMHKGWTGGDAAPATALGHTGFTGTGVWFDPVSGRFQVLLTNRVYPSREVKSGIADLRRSFNDAVWSEP
jgi:CubicO group peptidase (beta-lactamase class C family)